MAAFCFILGTILFLIMFRPIAFFLVFVPLILLFLACLWCFAKKGRGGYYVAVIAILWIMIIALVIVI